MKHIGEKKNIFESREREAKNKGEGSISFNQIFIYLLELRTAAVGVWFGFWVCDGNGNENK